MFFYEGFSCPVCGKPFSPEDDVVACPTCGAPHHRHCWQKQGHCHYEADHGTDRQWSRERQKTDTAKATGSASPDPDRKPCPHCGHPNPSFAEFCAHCGKPTGAEDWQSQRQAPPPPPPFGGFGGYSSPYGEYSPFRAADPYGGIAPEEELDGIPAAELAAFTGNNAAYYLPRFHKFARGGSKCSWNWAAFLIPSYWLLYRKQYLAGVVTLVVQIILTMLNGFIMYGALQLHTFTDPGAMAEAILQISSSSSGTLFLMATMLITVIEALLRVLIGLSGNWLYFRTATSRIRKLKGEAPTIDKTDIAAAGGVSMALGIVGYVMLNVASILAQYSFLS